MWRMNNKVFLKIGIYGVLKVFWWKATEIEASSDFPWYQHKFISAN